MTRPFAVVDLFSGPGGLGEGFSAYRRPDGRRFYRCLLSVEKERSAHRTLALRGFYWEFDGQPPESYYDFLNGESEEPDWEDRYPDEWRVARRAATRLELGTPDASTKLKRRIREIREKYGDRTVLLGGPPCQAYSLVGRARNTHLSEEARENDPRVSLHKEYVQALGWLRPAAFVMENVKGILSATLGGRRIFPEILRGLQNAGGTLGAYRLFALAPPSHRFNGVGPDSDFIVRAENHGVPQARHRVFVVGLRADLAASLPEGTHPRLALRRHRVHTYDVIGGMPRLRSGLSRNDNPDAWQRQLEEACGLVARNPPALPLPASERFLEALSAAAEHARSSRPFERAASGGTKPPESCPSELSRWLADPMLDQLPNNDTRGHMPADLARYVFSAAFAKALDRSPTAAEFPPALAPQHRNWRSGKFADRFRVQLAGRPSTTVTSHMSKDGHYFIHPDPVQCRSLTVREAARLQTFPDNYVFLGSRTEQYVQVGNAVPPFLARQIAEALIPALERLDPAVSSAGRCGQSSLWQAAEGQGSAFSVRQLQHQTEPEADAGVSPRSHS